MQIVFFQSVFEQFSSWIAWHGFRSKMDGFGHFVGGQVLPYVLLKFGLCADRTRAQMHHGDDGFTGLFVRLRKDRGLVHIGVMQQT